ncbi:unnamed protein product [Nesidiocoris tenuis]|uniref:Uncharacterized protein n=1 Tax=Nesidiocoris tenuis TaxID=355587 RepID=A0A6H5HW58_9HEMI|nr:unnamed protein product [Nesidiocoris tenuis]
MFFKTENSSLSISVVNAGATILTEKSIQPELDIRQRQSAQNRWRWPNVIPRQSLSTEQLKKSRNHLLVPPCSLSSRRPMPCAACLLELLNRSDSSSRKDTSRVYTKAEVPCPFMKMMSLCGDKCSCREVPPLDEEEEECPFLSKKTPAQNFGCPLKRVRSDPLVLDVSRIPDRGQPFDSQACPLVPGNCCYTAPGCAVHTGQNNMQKVASCFCS